MLPGTTKADEMDVPSKCQQSQGKKKRMDGKFWLRLVLTALQSNADRFEAGPRIPGARHMDMDDISTSTELYPERNPLGLYHMLPPPVRPLLQLTSKFLSLDVITHVRS
jgi:hypothetical protein